MDESQIDGIVQRAIEQYATSDRAKAEPAYKAELLEERRRREALEKRINELVEENRRSRMVAEESERSGAIRAELQRLGVAKVDLAYRAVQDGVSRTEDGRLVCRGSEGEVGLKEYLSSFVRENPEFLPARISGGAGIAAVDKAPSHSVDVEQIRAGMSKEEMDRVRQEIVRVASQQMRGV